jgi:predicted transcriptional regulator YdeE
MQAQAVEVPAFRVVGISEYTNNEKETQPETSIIPTLWQNFFQYNVGQMIPGVSETSALYGVYSNYASDENGEYQLLIGAEPNNEGVPNNLSEIHVQMGHYLVFKVPALNPQAIMQTWSDIEHYFSTPECAYERTFKTDFEKYEGKTSINIYIGVIEPVYNDDV